MRKWGLNMKTEKRKNGEGTVRKVEQGVYEAICQSSIPNPETLKYKRFKRRGATANEALSAAQMAMRAWEKSFTSGEIIDKKKTFGEYIFDYLDEVRKPNISASTYFNYVSVINAYIQKEIISKYQLSMLNREAFANYYNSMLARVKASTMTMPISLCKGCCKWLVDRSLLKENYAEQATLLIKKEVKDEFDYKKEDELKKRKEIFSTEDIQKVYDMWQNKEGGEYVGIFLLLLESGLRSQEFASLRLQCIDLENRLIYVRESQAIRYKNNDRTSGEYEHYDKTTKNNESRIIKISDLSYEIILWMMDKTKKKCKNGNPGNLLFPVMRNGKKRSNHCMAMGMRYLFLKIGIDRSEIEEIQNGKVVHRGLCVHSIRHTYESLVRQNSENNLVAVALSTGHKTDMKMEDYYTHQVHEAVQGIITPSEQLWGNSKGTQEKPLESSNTKLQGVNESMSDKDKELYEMYLKLKEKFE